MLGENWDILFLIFLSLSEPKSLDIKTGLSDLPAIRKESREVTEGESERACSFCGSRGKEKLLHFQTPGFFFHLCCLILLLLKIITLHISYTANAVIGN